MMKKMMKKLVAVVMMSLTLAAPPARSAEAAGHDRPAGGQPRQEQRLGQRGSGKHEQRMSQFDGHKDQRAERHQPLSRVPEHRMERRSSNHDSDTAAAMVGGLILGVIIGAAIESASN